MLARMLIVVAATAVLVGGAFVLRTAAPAEQSVQAVSLGQTPGQLPPERQHGSVSVVTEVVTAPTIASWRGVGSPAPLHRRTPAEPKRSLIARLFLGNGQPRPQPFPQPGRAVSARP